MEFKLIVAGGRDFEDYETLSRVIFALADVELADKEISIVSGMAKGADALGYMFAHRNHVKVYEYYADWNRHGKSAGMIRNKQMGNEANGLLAFWDGDSKGTGHMITYMKSLNKPVYLVEY